MKLPPQSNFIIPRLRLSAVKAGSKRQTGIYFIFVVGLLSFGLLYQVIQPVFFDGSYRRGDSAEQPFLSPLFLAEGPMEPLHIRLSMRLSAIHPTRFQLIPDDCLQSLVINDLMVDDPLLPFCDYRSGEVLNLGAYLHTGVNTIVAVTENHGWGAGFRIQPARTDPLLLTITFTIVLLLATFGTLLLRRRYPQATPLQTVEWFFLCSFLVLRGILFFIRKGTIMSFDGGAHLEMVRAISWTDPVMGVQEMFLSYHPPLGFLLPHTFYALGFSDVVSVQIVSMAASLLSFFFLRKIVKKLAMLHTLPGIVFVYFTSSIPLQIYLATSLNTDVLILGFGSILIYLCLRLFWLQSDDAWHGRSSWLFAILCTLVMTLGLYTKYNSILFLAVPWLMILFGNRTQVQRKLLTALFICSTALALALPFYYVRNYREVGTLFPSNTEWAIPAGMASSRQTRDADRLQWFKRLLTPRYFLLFPKREDLPVLQLHDSGTPRLSDTWADVWMANISALSQSNTSEYISLWYLRIVPWLIVIGFIGLFVSIKQRSHWHRFGWWLLAYFLLNVASLIVYVYQNPDAGYKPTKAIYISLVTWLIGFLTASFTSIVRSDKTTLYYFFSIGNTLLLFTFMVFNHLLPVY